MPNLWEGFDAAMNRRAERGAPSGARAGMDRYGWSTREVAQRFGVSERTARRWRQQNRIPERRRDDWRRETSGAAKARTRARIGQRGLSKLTATGQYKISKSQYKARKDRPAKLQGDNRISPATMRDVFDAADAGDTDLADELLNQALAEGYGAPGLKFEDIDDVEFGI